MTRWGLIDSHSSMRWVVLGTLSLVVSCGDPLIAITHHDDLGSTGSFTSSNEVTLRPLPEHYMAKSSDWPEDRMVIDKLVINVEDIRLVGGDPRFPAGGLSLLQEPALLSTDDIGGLNITLPEQFATGDDLRLFVYLNSSSILDRAAIEMHARFYPKRNPSDDTEIEGLKVLFYDDRPSDLMVHLQRNIDLPISLSSFIASEFLLLLESKLDTKTGDNIPVEIRISRTSSTPSNSY